MWWFLRERSRADAMGADDEATDRSTQPTAARNAYEAEMLQTIPDMRGWARHDVAIKVWLPESAARLLKCVAGAEGVSQSSWVRECLFEYVYGRAAAMAYRLRLRRDSAGDIRLSRTPVDRTKGRYIYKVPQLGKDIIAFKFWVNERLKADLEVLAQHAQVQLSPFVREAVLGRLCGRATLPERPNALALPTRAAADWDSGGEVAVTEIEEADYQDLGWAERVWVDGGLAGAATRNP